VASHRRRCGSDSSPSPPLVRTGRKGAGTATRKRDFVRGTGKLVPVSARIRPQFLPQAGKGLAQPLRQARPSPPTLVAIGQHGWCVVVVWSVCGCCVVGVWLVCESLRRPHC
jgi:hypothetical protein